MSAAKMQLMECLVSSHKTHLLGREKKEGEGGKGREKVVPCPRLKVFEGESS